MLYLEPIKEFEDGSANYLFSYDRIFLDYYKKETGAQKIDDKEIGKFIVNRLEQVFAEPEEKYTRKEN